LENIYLNFNQISQSQLKEGSNNNSVILFVVSVLREGYSTFSTLTFVYFSYFFCSLVCLLADVLILFVLQWKPQR